LAFVSRKVPELRLVAASHTSPGHLRIHRI